MENDSATTKSRTFMKQSRQKSKALILCLALMLGIVAVPVAANAAEVTYFSGATIGETRISSKQVSRLTGGKGWAVTWRKFQISNVYPWMSHAGGSWASQGNVATFTHSPVKDGFSGCVWGLGFGDKTKVGMTCKYFT